MLEGFLARGDWDERLARGRDNSFDAVRLVLASLVVLEHSFFVIDNRADGDPIFRLTGGQSNSGVLAVYFFFVISGFLVTRSWLTDPNLGRFLARRVGRIVPAFVVAAAVGYLIIGPLASASVSQYFASQKWFSIILETLALKPAVVTGAFPNNPISLVHGTLWTIQYEFDCYIVVALLGLAGLFINWRVTTFSLIAVLLVFATVFQRHLPAIDHGWLAFLISSPVAWPYLLPFFFLGSAFYVFRKSIPKSPLLFGCAVAVLITSARLGYFFVAALTCGSYAVLYVALSTGSSIRVLRRKVDISYGIYLYGWPIQQFILSIFLGRMTPLILFPSAMVFTCATALLSWNFVEAPCLKLVRNRKASRPSLASDESVQLAEAGGGAAVTGSH